MAIDSPDDRKMGTASAAAHAAAAKAVQKPEFVRAAAQAHDVPPPPADDAVDEPVDDDVDDSPTDDREDGPSPTPTPTGDDDDAPEEEDEDVTDDYNEEEQAEGDDEDESEDRPKTKADSPKKDHEDETEKTWNQYKTDADRKKALAENKRYGIEMSNKAKELQAKLDALEKPADGKAPTPTPEVKAETREETVRRLMAEREDFQQEVGQLREYRDSITAKVDERATLKTKRDADVKTQSKLQAQIEYLEEQQKTDPENYDLKTQIEARQRQIERIDVALDKTDTRDTRLEIEISNLQTKYQAGSQRVQTHILDDERGRAEKVKAQASAQKEREATETAWNETVPKVVEACKIPKESRDDFEEDLLVLADSVLNRTGHIPDLNAWMLEQGKRIAAKYNRARTAGTVKYVEAKKRDAAQSAPTGASAVATKPKKGDRYDHRQADREAQAAMRRNLAR